MGTHHVSLRFYDMLLNDYRMPQPHFAPREVYRIMSECWAKEPLHRPRYVSATLQLWGINKPRHRHAYGTKKSSRIVDLIFFVQIP